MKNVLIIEDEISVLEKTAELLKDSDDIRLNKGLNLYDADGYIYDEGMSFDLMIIDFALGDDYKFEDEEDIAALDRYGADKKHLVGWVWIKRFLREHPNFDKRRIVGVSAYTDLLDKSEVEEVGIRLIDKKSSDSARLLLETVRSI